MWRRRATTTVAAAVAAVAAGAAACAAHAADDAAITAVAAVAAAVAAAALAPPAAALAPPVVAIATAANGPRRVREARAVRLGGCRAQGSGRAARGAFASHPPHRGAREC